MVRISVVDKLACGDSASSRVARLIEESKKVIRRSSSPLKVIDLQERSQPGSFAKTRCWGISVPTRYRMQAYRPAPSWCSTWETIYSKLEPLAVEILQPTGFYERYDIEIPQMIGGRALGVEEKDAIGRIATALTIAADAAHRTPPGIVAAWLDRIAENPALFRSEQLPPEVDWQIASCYRRGSERPGTHVQDVWGRRRVRFEARARRATLPRIERAARLAAASLRRPRGRPPNDANHLLAEYLASAFRGCGGQIVRRQAPIDKKGGGVRYVEIGPFHQFLKMVIGPLQEHLERHGLPRVTIETVERIATEKFALGG